VPTRGESRRSRVQTDHRQLELALDPPPLRIVIRSVDRCESFDHEPSQQVADGRAVLERTRDEDSSGTCARRPPPAAHCDLMALGNADAVRAENGTGKVTIIGLDGIAEALAAIRSRTISATV
jgi:hypothetical protein